MNFTLNTKLCKLFLKIIRNLTILQHCLLYKWENCCNCFLITPTFFFHLLSPSSHGRRIHTFTKQMTFGNIRIERAHFFDHSYRVTKFFMFCQKNGEFSPTCFCGSGPTYKGVFLSFHFSDLPTSKKWFKINYWIRKAFLGSFCRKFFFHVWRISSFDANVHI